VRETDGIWAPSGAVHGSEGSVSPPPSEADGGRTCVSQAAAEGFSRRQPIVTLVRHASLFVPGVAPSRTVRSLPYAAQKRAPPDVRTSIASSPKQGEEMLRAQWDREGIAQQTSSGERHGMHGSLSPSSRAGPALGEYAKRAPVERPGGWSGRARCRTVRFSEGCRRLIARGQGLFRTRIVILVNRSDSEPVPLCIEEAAGKAALAESVRRRDAQGVCGSALPLGR